MRLAVWLLLTGCAGAAPPLGDTFALRGGQVVGVGAVDVAVKDGVIVAVGEVEPATEEVDVSGQWLVPAFIDSHVHFAYLPEIDAMADGGVAAAVDLAAPIDAIRDDAVVRTLWAGPMITAVGGYPTQSWGAGGYGLEVAGAEAAEAAVDRVLDAGATLVKVPVTSTPTLTDTELAAVTERAHARGVRVVAHALGDTDATRAAAAGADVLAHTPTVELDDATVAAWSDRAVISTLEAFGGSPTAAANLRRLREAGATVLYGTDFGNSRTPGIQRGELLELQEAGLDGAAILAAGTTTPAAYWGLSDLGAIEPGKRASLLVLARDPLTDPTALAEPEWVLIDGARR